MIIGKTSFFERPEHDNTNMPAPEHDNTNMPANDNLDILNKNFFKSLVLRYPELREVGVLEKSNQLEEAIEKLNSFLKSNVNKSDELIVLKKIAKIHHKNKHYKKAVEVFFEIDKIFYSSTNFLDRVNRNYTNKKFSNYLDIANSYYKNKQYNEAFTILSKKPTCHGSQKIAGDINFKRKKYNRAKKHYSNALKIFLTTNQMEVNPSFIKVVERKRAKAIIKRNSKAGNFKKVLKNFKIKKYKIEDYFDGYPEKVKLIKEFKERKLKQYNIEDYLDTHPENFKKRLELIDSYVQQERTRRAGMEITGTLTKLEEGNPKLEEGNPRLKESAFYEIELKNRKTLMEMHSCSERDEMWRRRISKLADEGKKMTKKENFIYEEDRVLFETKWQTRFLELIAVCCVKTV
jgi:predicted negative regulator of RcsB-dependent stress response